MIYRLVLIASGLLMMFFIFGLVMFIGSLSGDTISDSAMGNAILTGVFLFLTLVVLRIGLGMRKSMHRKFESAIADMSATNGHIDAVNFADTVGITLDSARDVLDAMARKRHWRREELTGYNARYYA